MKELPSREFRQTWTRLTEETVSVTSNGRDIGYWVPVGTDEWWLIKDGLKDDSSSSASGGSEPSSRNELGEFQPT